MGLEEILSNPGILGLAMAGLSRNPQAPMQAYSVYSDANKMAREDRMLEEAKKEKELQRADTLGLAQAMMGGQQQEGNDFNRSKRKRRSGQNKYRC